MSVIAILVCGGNSKRMNLPEQSNKVFLTLNNKPIIYYSLQAFQHAKSVDSVFISVRSQDISIVESILKKFKFNKVAKIVTGGHERQDSVYNALNAISHELFSKNNIVLIHDGARPFIQAKTIDDMFALAQTYGIVIPFRKPTDTVRTLNNLFFDKTLNRETLAFVQTPQLFPSQLIKNAHEQAKHENFYSTDDSSLIKRFYPNQKAFGFEMPYPNTKITSPDDLLFATAYFKKICSI